MHETRRRLLARLAAGAAAGMLAEAAPAQPAYPSRPVRVVVPFLAGGTADVIARPICERLAKVWGQPVLVDNRAGAAGMLGTDQVAKAAADGYTLLMTITSLVQAPALYGKAPFDPIRDLAAVSELATSQIVLMAAPELPVKQVKDLPAYAARTGKPLAYGSYGQGSSGHLQMEIFGRVAKLPLQHVAYKGESPLIQDLASGQILLGVMGGAAAVQQSRAGNLRPLAVLGASRSPLLPDVPTFQESGFAGLDRAGWFGLFAPAGVPPALVERISADANGALADAGLRERMLQLGVVLKGSTPRAFAALVKSEQAYWSQAIRAADIRLY